MYIFAYCEGGIVASQMIRTIRIIVIVIQIVIRMQFRLRFGSGDDTGKVMMGSLFRVSFSSKHYSHQKNLIIFKYFQNMRCWNMD